MKKYLGIFKGVKIPWILIIIILVSAFVESHITVGSTTLTADIIDASSKTISSKMLIRYIGFLSLLAIVSIIRSWLGQIAYGRVNMGVRNKVFKHVLHMPMKYYDNVDSNEMVSRVINDCDSASSYFEVIVDTLSAIYASVIIFIELIRDNHQLGMYSLLIIPVSVAIALVYGYITFTASAKSVNSYAVTTGYLFERVAALKMIKAFNTQVQEKIEGNKVFQKMFEADLLAEMSIAFALLGMQIVTCVSMVIAFVFGGQMVKDGLMTIGELVKFYSLGGVVGVQLVNLFLGYGGITSINGALKKVSEILLLEEEKTVGNDVDTQDQDITFNDVSFAYEDSVVLNHIHVTIPKNKITAIIGTNGAGKSTMFKLLERMYEPTSGEILFGSTDIHSYNLHSYRDLFAIVSQDSPMMSGTIRECMCYGSKKTVTDEELLEVAKKTGLYEYICSQEKGLDSFIDIGSTNLSGGQRQLFTIARAIIKDSRYLLLDEATKSLDAVSESKVKDALDHLMKNKTTIMIAHNPSAIEHADRIIVMKDGQVDDVGTKEELITRNEYYKVFCGGK